MSRREYDFEKFRAKFTAKTENNDNEKLPNNYYPFYKMKLDESARVRFLPDKNQSNEMDFYVTRVFHPLKINGENKSVPCLTMYGHKTEECPICALSTEYFAKDDKKNGSAYWRKYQYITQVLVIEDPLPANDNGEKFEGKVKLLSLGKTLFNVIEDAIKSRDIDSVPFAYTGGTDFIIKKSRQGENNSYVLSKFARNSTDLDEEVIDFVEEHLIDLSTVLPKNPGVEKLEAWLEAALTGTSVEMTSEELVDSSSEEDEVKTKASAPVSTKSAVTSSVVEETRTESSSSKPTVSGQSILDKIKNRNA